jgi:hypothetical protein
MKTITQQTEQAQLSKHSLIHDAFVVLLEHLGPEKTMQLWHLFLPAQADYVKTRRTLFAGKDVAALAQDARKFHRE